MLRRTMFTGAVAITLLGVSVGLTQEQKNAQGRGGSGGFFGGPGGGFGGGGLMLLGMSEVQKELGISDEQKDLIQDVQADLMEQLRSSFGNFNFQDFQNLSREEAQKRMEEGRKKGEELGKQADEMLATILEPKQLERLNQLRLQREGVWAIGRPEVADKLGLSQEQRADVRKILDGLRPDPGQFGGFRREMSEEERREAFAKMREQFDKLREKGEKARTDILSLLTPEQKQSWENMLGPKFEFPQRPFGGFGRPGGDSPRSKDASKSQR